MADYKTITINPGQHAFIPKNAVVLAISETGNSQAQTECLDLSTVGQFVCMEIRWEFEIDNGGGTGPWSVSQYPLGAISGIILGDSKQAIERQFNNATGVISDINNGPFSGLFQDLGFASGSLSNERYYRYLYFRVPSSVADSVALEFRIADINLPKF